MVDTLAPLPRHLVSDGYDAALYALARALPVTVHRYPTGAEAFTWIVPERWMCRSARLETMSGEVVFSDKDNPLHVVS
jgi:aminopeptidase-like protein